VALKIPMVFRTKAKNADLRKWVDGKRCPREDYFRSIDGYRMIQRRHLPDATDPDFPFLVASVAKLLDQEESLYGHLVAKDLETTDAGEWEQFCIAAAYVVVDRYDKAVTDGTWEPVL
jgi:hypothetical protein